MMSSIEPSRLTLLFLSFFLSLQTVVDGTRHGELRSTIQVSLFVCIIFAVDNVCCT